MYDFLFLFCFSVPNKSLVIDSNSVTNYLYMVIFTCSSYQHSRIPKNESLFCFHGGEAKCIDSNYEEEQDSKDACGSLWSTSSPNARVSDKVTKGYRKMVFQGKKCQGKSKCGIHYQKWPFLEMKDFQIDFQF